MLDALMKALSQISDPAFRRVFWRSLLVSLVVFALLWAGAWLLFDWLELWLAGFVDLSSLSPFWQGVFEFLLGAASLVALLFATLLFFPAVIGIVLSILLDDVARAVEARHYPQLPPARGQPWAEMIVDGLRFAAVTIGLNLLFLPLYLLLLFVPPLNLFVFYGLNGYLLGREYFELVSVRRLNSADGNKLRRRYKGRVLLAGVFIAVMMTVPLANLVAPMVATGFMLHLFEDLRRRSDAELANAVR